MNQLSQAKSPYLLQHKDNPVHWMEWGEAAFQKARDEDKPIFLSVGYSTCHWCHVMERESFENEAVAQVMNQHFINIKVDREERPDIDRVYMTYVQSATGSGGWPMSVFLTPDLKPFYGGTYFPPDDAYGRPGFTSLLNAIAAAWRDDRAEILQSVENTMRVLNRYNASEKVSASTQIPWQKIYADCFSHFVSSYDARYGGFGDAPKFPRPVAHDFLHRYAVTSGEEKALSMSRHTLAAMSDGGMNDQLGGGFHRYSVDPFWVVSHFEKMLYDQAQLAISYLEMFQMTREAFFAVTARNILDYVLRDLMHEGGAFFSAEDADSFASTQDAENGDAHKEEGAFYVWTTAELREVLGEENANIVGYFYGARDGGNAPAQGDPHGEFRGKNILYFAHDLNETAQHLGKAPEEVARVLEESRKLLFAAREKRPRPHRDEKIIVAWNGLMISAFARAAQALHEPRYADVSTQALEFIRRELWNAESKTLRRHWQGGASEIEGFADDYAALARAALDVWETTFDAQYLDFAEALLETLHRDFHDAHGGGYFSAKQDENVLLRMKEDYDGAEPSANALAAEALLRAARVLERDDFAKRAEKLLRGCAHRIQKFPAMMPALLGASMLAQTPPFHIVIVGELDDEMTQEYLRLVHQRFGPFKTLIVLTESNRAMLENRLPFVREMKKVDDRATAYICRDFACRAPVNTPEDFWNELNAAP